MANSNLNKKSAGFLAEADGLCAITVTATCHKNQDLRVEIDGRGFRELAPEKYAQKFNIPAAFNGTKLKGKTQINIFILHLTKGRHKLDFIAQNGAEIIDWEQRKINDPKNALCELNLRADNCERQPFVNLILVDLPLHSIIVDAEVAWHKASLFRGDGDDLKLTVDGKVYTDNKTPWLFRSTKEQAKTGAKSQRKVVVTNLPPAIHYLEFTADRSPALKQVFLDLSKIKREISHVGDFKCMTGIKNIGGTDLNVLAIYKHGRNDKVFVRSNENYRLYFDGVEQPVGDDYKGPESIPKIRFDLFSLKGTSADEEWFYFGVDSTFIFWHPFEWVKDELWTIYEKEN